MRSFESIYQEVKANRQELENVRKEEKKRVMMTIGEVVLFYVVISNCYSPSVVWMAIKLALALGLFIFMVKGIMNLSKSNVNYKKIYKKKVIQTFIKAYDDNLNYEPEKGMDSKVYQQAEFEGYDKYYSEDLIEGLLEGHPIRMAEVHTQHVRTDSNGNTTETTIFQGLLGVTHFKNVYHGTLKIRLDNQFLGMFFRKNKQRIEMDSGEFEKYFEVMADDKIQAMQILTSDIMDKMISFVKESKIKYEITIKSDCMYIRFITGSVFETSLWKPALDYQTLKKLYVLIHFTFDLTSAFIKVMNETEI